MADVIWIFLRLTWTKRFLTGGKYVEGRQSRPSGVRQSEYCLALRITIGELLGDRHTERVGDHRHVSRRRAQVGIDLWPLARRLGVDYLLQRENVIFD